jgi:hypothetical protein
LKYYNTLVIKSIEHIGVKTKILIYLKFFKIGVIYINLFLLYVIYKNINLMVMTMDPSNYHQVSLFLKK